MTEIEGELVKAGEALAGMLGVALAAMDDREPFNPIEMDMARTEILRWHRIRALCEE